MAAGGPAEDGQIAPGGDLGRGGDLVGAARRVADEVLAPHAEETDQAELVPRSNLDALAAAGLFGMACGKGASAAEMRSVQEALAGACGATYFVWAQHHSPVRLLQVTPNATLAERWLGPMCRGEAIAGVAFAFLRRPGPPAMTAEPVPGGWKVSGTAPFVTSWGLAELFVVAAVASGRDGEADRIVWFCLPGKATDSVRPSPPLALSVLQATSTVILRLDNLSVPDLDVLKVEPLDAWRVRDHPATARPPAAALGVAERCCQLLAGVAADQPGPAERAAFALAGELVSCRARAYGLADVLSGIRGELPVDAGEADAGEADAGGGEVATSAPLEGDALEGDALEGDALEGDALEAHLAEMVDARAWCLDLAQRASLALVAAVGGRAMTRSHPAQRLAREAAFYAVQAQTGAIRAATLRRLTRPTG